MTPEYDNVGTGHAGSVEKVTRELLGDRPRTALYLRTSTVEQGEKGNSLEEQLEKTTRHAELLGWEVDEE